MTGAERGFLLLTSQLGNPERRPLTVAQLRLLGQRVRQLPPPVQDRDLTVADIARLGYDKDMAWRVVSLLEEEDLLECYLEKAARVGCVPLTRRSATYPVRARRLDPDAPGCLWAKGELSLLERPAVALVGSRKLNVSNEAFARAAGVQAARQGYVLVSGGAIGADRQAQSACLEAGGNVICVTADSLAAKQPQSGMLYLSEEGFDRPFTAQRALSRNRVIHCLGDFVLVAQSGLEKGGTWNGTVQNLRHGWTPVWCFQDGSQSVQRLCQMGARTVSPENLKRFSLLAQTKENKFAF